MSLVTRKDDGPFDFDYNLVFSYPKDIDLGAFKSRSASALDVAALHYGFGYGSDFTSAITYVHKIGLKEDFHLDVGIILKTKEHESRLLHKKFSGTYTAEISIDLSSLDQKLSDIKKSHKKADLRRIYLNKKNSPHDEKTHPSYVLYTEAVNETWQLI